MKSFPHPGTLRCQGTWLTLATDQAHLMMETGDEEVEPKENLSMLDWKFWDWSLTMYFSFQPWLERFLKKLRKTASTDPFFTRLAEFLQSYERSKRLCSLCQITPRASLEKVTLRDTERLCWAGRGVPPHIRYLAQYKASDNVLGEMTPFMPAGSGMRNTRILF